MITLAPKNKTLKIRLSTLEVAAMRFAFGSWIVFVLVGITGLSAAHAGYQGLGSESVSSELIKKFAATTLPIELSRAIQSHMDIRSAGAGLVSENAREMYFSWNVTGQTQVWKLNGPNTFPVQMTGGEDRTYPLGLSPDGKKLFISRDRSGEENPGLYWQSTLGGPLQLIQHLPKVQTSLEFILSDGKTIFIRSNDQKADSYSIYKFDLETSSKTLLWNKPGLWRIADVREGKEILLERSKGSLQVEYWVAQWGTWNAEPLLGVDEAVDYDVSFAPQPGSYFVRTNKFGDFRRLYLWRGGTYSAVTPEVSRDVEAFQIDQNRKRLLIQWNQDGYTRLEARDARTLKLISLPQFPGADHVRAVNTTRNSRFTTIAVESSTSPRVNYVLDWNSKKLLSWQKASSPEIDTSTFTTAQIEHYPARDGTQIPLLVRRPKICLNRLCPVIVSFHGSPEAQARPGFAPTLEVLLGRGFVLVEPNVRGSDGYGKSWLEADNGAKRLNVISDIEDCAKFIRSNWKHDGKEPKLGVMGGSYGGYSTLMAMTKFAGSYDAGVAIVGMSNLATFLKNTAPYRRILRINEYGDPDKDKDALSQLSPTSYLDRLKSPLLIIQGVNDPRVPVGEAIQFYNALEKKKVDRGLILFADEGHGVAKRENRVLELGHTILFFEQHLKD